MSPIPQPCIILWKSSVFCTKFISTIAIYFQINIDLDNPGLHSIPVCAEHYGAVEHLMVCAICKRRLARNHIHYLGNECDMLNAALQKEGIPVTLNDKPVVCKLCRYFASLLLKPPPSESQSNTAEFFRSYKKRLVTISYRTNLESKRNFLLEYISLLA